MEQHVPSNRNLRGQEHHAASDLGAWVSAVCVWISAATEKPSRSRDYSWFKAHKRCPLSESLKGNLPACRAVQRGVFSLSGSINPLMFNKLFNQEQLAQPSIRNSAVPLGISWVRVPGTLTPDWNPRTGNQFETSQWLQQKIEAVNTGWFSVVLWEICRGCILFFLPTSSFVHSEEHLRTTHGIDMKETKTLPYIETFGETHRDEQ